MAPQLAHDWTTNGECPICEGPANVRHLEQRDAARFQCDRCGYIDIDGLFTLAVESDQISVERHILSAVCRIQSERGIRLDFRTEEDVRNAVSGVSVPTSVNEQLNLVLKAIAERQQRVDTDSNVLAEWDFPLGFCHDENEFTEMVEMLRLQGLIREPTNFGGSGLRLTPEGWERSSSLEDEATDSDQAFVAMDFRKELTPAYDNGFYPGLEAAGWRPVRADRVEHAGSINDFIASQIRVSGLIIADFTYGNSGVYFEAGLAFGLPKQVIWTCRSDQLDELHFDIRQYSNILWDDPKDLATKLERRVRGMGLAR